MDLLVEEEEMTQKTWMINPLTYVTTFLASYGWFLTVGVAMMIWLYSKIQPSLKRWRDQKEDAEFRKDPDKMLARLEAVQRARERQQMQADKAARQALLAEEERKERKRREAAEALERAKAGGSAGQRLGSRSDGYLPLSGGAGGSNYRPPKRSACSKGGCGK